jgi:tetratricopeptide (TPR) repeat protein
MENRLEEVHEHLEHLEHVASRKFKTVITVMVLLVTGAATVAGVLVALWSGHESSAQSARQELAAEAVSADLHANALFAANSEQQDQQTEVGWEAAFLRLHKEDVDSATATLIERQAQVADQQRKQGSSITTAQLNDASAKQMIAEQESHAKASEAAEFASKESGALTVISILAVSLFLLGLAPTIPVQLSRWLFVALATVGLLVSGVRLAVVASGSSEVPTSSCIEDYAHSQFASTYDDEIKELKGVVSACPSFADAYEQLADAQSGLGTKQGFLDAEANYRKALDLRPAYAAILYNNLATAQLFDGHAAAAQDSLDHAIALDPHNEVTLASQAEQRAFSGDSAGANRYLDRALALVATHGSYFRGQYFASLRTDYELTQSMGIHTATTDAFYRRVKNAEASLDVYGKPTPGDAHGATVSSITVRKAKGKLGDDGCATFGYQFQGFHAGDHVSVRWYQYGTTFSLAQSEIDGTIDGSGDGGLDPDSGYVVPTTPGSWTVEVYLNGNLLKSATFDMPKGSDN